MFVREECKKNLGMELLQDPDSNVTVRPTFCVLHRHLKDVPVLWTFIHFDVVEQLEMPNRRRCRSL